MRPGHAAPHAPPSPPDVRRSLDVDLTDLIRSLSLIADDPVGDDPDADDTTRRILDAATELFGELGIRRSSMDDIAERSGLGRTTVYRHFAGRSQVVTAVLARECRRFFTSILLSTAHLGTLTDAVVEGMLTGLRSAETSLLSDLVRSEPEVLRLLTVDAGPLIAVGREFLVTAFGEVVDEADRHHLAVVAEVLVRLAMSYVCDDRSVLDLQHEDRARADLHRLLDPIVGPLESLRS